MRVRVCVRVAVRDAARKCIARKCFCPCVHTSTYKRLHLLRYSIHIRCPDLSPSPLSSPAFLLPFIPPVLAHHQCQYFVASRVLPIPPPTLYCIILRGNCSEFQPLKRVRNRAEGGNNKCGCLDASTRFHVQIRTWKRGGFL